MHEYNNYMYNTKLWLVGILIIVAAFVTSASAYTVMAESGRLSEVRLPPFMVDQSEKNTDISVPSEFSLFAGQTVTLTNYNNVVVKLNAAGKNACEALYNSPTCLPTSGGPVAQIVVNSKSYTMTLGQTTEIDGFKLTFKSFDLDAKKATFQVSF